MIVLPTAYRSMLKAWKGDNQYTPTSQKSNRRSLAFSKGAWLACSCNKILKEKSHKLSFSARQRRTVLSIDKYKRRNANVNIIYVVRDGVVGRLKTKKHPTDWFLIVKMRRRFETKVVVRKHPPKIAASLVNRKQMTELAKRANPMISIFIASVPHGTDL